jgi:hypothetical protein
MEARLAETVAALRDALAAAAVQGKPLCAKVAGFSLHAAHAVAATDRAGLERLCRYGLREPFSQERLARRADGLVVYHLRRPWPHAEGATRLVLEPLDLLRRLAALVPAPYSHMVRYHGLFGNRSRWRSRLPSPPALLVGPDPGGEAGRANGDHAAVTGVERAGGAEGEAAGEVEADPASPSAAALPCRRRRLSWAQLLLRVFFVDALRCPKCETAMVVLVLISDLKVVAKILRHLGLAAEPPVVSPARCRSEAGLPLDMDLLDPDVDESLDPSSADVDDDPGAAAGSARGASPRPPP